MLKNAGKLILISGPMYSGKTRKLITFFNELESKNKIAISPKIDNSTKMIESRNGTSIKSTIKLQEIDEIENEAKNYDNIFIDEVQFFEEKIISLISKWKNNGKNIYVSGLDLDFRKKEFVTYKELKKIADREYKMTAICHYCNNISKYSNKDLSKSRNPNKVIEIDDKTNTIYFSSCKKCHNGGNDG